LDWYDEGRIPVLHGVSRLVKKKMMLNLWHFIFKNRFSMVPARAGIKDKKIK
jgi:hypothetical protein